ncbi:MAG: hypothetical protein ACREJ5_28090 [Geminicoccaceae bacterium]
MKSLRLLACPTLAQALEAAFQRRRRSATRRAVEVADEARMRI